MHSLQMFFKKRRLHSLDSKNLFAN